jgi:cold shock CspA family protein
MVNTQAEGPVLRGSIIKFFEDRGFGFIRPSDDGEDDVFFHKTELPDWEVPKHGASVEYQVETNSRGKRRAVNVKYASAPHEQAEVRFGEK